ncbi:MAG: phosphate transport system regulatory protein PhoU [Alphaproteobacteria bacterium 16-39-46]|nr:MAG: phosphate transport system regulatory protein PhoU [Alphaproteobacteria bacterium 16-39-46]OZA42724.1 MAG: phosphate transport system regulatory protein PhoU [Alphaproteobacteria bacterium 17-39-52]HQS83626.1 phosphate signaling complex protein PhoU [Alphaproteobacteria bacterium]HQS93367.1 phosphate signaling complex protein PhoU [Alphaproteobacteria bacterium]
MLITDHIVKSYDDELNRLTAMILEMGQLLEAQLEKVLECLTKGDNKIAQEIVDKDIEVDRLENKIDTSAVRLLALRQPVASDLRNVVAALKISAHLERMADYAVNVSKRVIALNQMGPIKYVSSITRLVRLVQEMIRDVLKAYSQLDDKAAHEIWKRDEEVDELYNGFVRELLTYMMEDPRNISPCIHILFIAKNIERMGDHVTNIAEHIHYLVHGTLWSESRK